MIGLRRPKAGKDARRYAAAPYSRIKAGPKAECGAGSKEVAKLQQEIDTLVFNSTLSDVLVQCATDYDDRADLKNDTLEMAFALSAHLKSLLRIAYMVDAYGISEEEMGEMMEALDLLAGTTEFGEVAISGIEQSAQLTDELLAELNKSGEGGGTAAGMGTNVIDGVPVEGGYAEGMDADSADTGAHFLKIPWQTAGSTALAVLSPAFGGIYRDLVVPAWEFYNFWKWCATELGKARATTYNIVGCIVEELMQHKVKYGFKFVVRATQVALRIFYLMPGYGVTAAVGQEFMANTYKVDFSGYSFWSAVPTAESVWWKSYWSRDPSGFLGGTAAQTAAKAGVGSGKLPVRIGAVVESFMGQGKTKTDSEALLYAAERLLGLTNENRALIRTWVEQINSDDVGGMLSPTHAALINLALFLLQVGIDYMSKTHTSHANAAFNKKTFAKIEAKLKERYPYAANTTNFDEQTANAIFSQNANDILEVARRIIFFNGKIKRNTAHKREKLDNVRLSLAVLLKLSNLIGGPMQEQTMNPVQRALLQYATALHDWYSQPGWTPETQGKPQLQAAAQEQFDDEDDDEGLGLEALVPMNAPADRSGSIVEQVFAAHAMRRALERAQ